MITVCVLGLVVGGWSPPCASLLVKQRYRVSVYRERVLVLILPAVWHPKATCRGQRFTAILSASLGHLLQLLRKEFSTESPITTWRRSAGTVEFRFPYWLQMTWVSLNSKSSVVPYCRLRPDDDQDCALSTYTSTYLILFYGLVVNCNEQCECDLWLLLEMISCLQGIEYDHATSVVSSERVMIWWLGTLVTQSLEQVRWLKHWLISSWCILNCSMSGFIVLNTSRNSVLEYGLFSVLPDFGACILYRLKVIWELILSNDFTDTEVSATGWKSLHSLRRVLFGSRMCELFSAVWAVCNLVTLWKMGCHSRARLYRRYWCCQGGWTYMHGHLTHWDFHCTMRPHS